MDTPTYAVHIKRGAKLRVVSISVPEPDTKSVLALAQDALVSLNWDELFEPARMHTSDAPSVDLRGRTLYVAQVLKGCALVVELNHKRDADGDHEDAVAPKVTHRIYAVRIHRDGDDGYEEVSVCLPNDMLTPVQDIADAARLSIKGGDQLEAYKTVPSLRPSVQIFGPISDWLDTPGSYLSVYVRYDARVLLRTLNELELHDISDKVQGDDFMRVICALDIRLGNSYTRTPATREWQCVYPVSNTLAERKNFWRNMHGRQDWSRSKVNAALSQARVDFRLK